MVEMSLRADVRKRTGKSAAKALRREGRVPAVIYGRDMRSQPIVISVKEWERLHKQLKGNAILKMELNESGVQREYPVMLKDIQRDILKDKVIHIDFLQVSMERKVEVEIPIVLIGEAKGQLNNGIVELHLRSIMVECLPAQIPEKVEIDITELEIGDSIHVKDILIPGTRLLEGSDVAIVTVIPPTLEEKAATEVTAEVVEPKETKEG
jgi:large subunit ribosomal protein L25